MYRIERLAMPEQFEAARAAWEQLLATGARAPVFLTWEWVSTWCRHVEPDWEAWVLLAWNADGNLAGVLPLMRVHHTYGPLQVRRLAFIGSNYAYRTHLDLAAAPHEEQAVVDAFMGYLKQQAGVWDVLDLEGLAAGSPLRDALARAGGQFAEKEPVDCPYTPLPATWKDYEMEQLSANRRQQIRARRRHLERDFPGQVVFQTVKHAGELPPAMDNLVRLHRLRWHGRGQASSFDVPSFLDFHRDIAARALECGWLRLYLLKIGDRAIAVEYCYLYDGVLFDYQKGFDPDPTLERYSPGQLLLAYAIQEAIAEGARELDMARGTYDYKFSWTHASRPDGHILLSTSPVGHLWLAGGQLVAGAKARTRELLPEETRQRINHALSGRRRTAAVEGAPGP